MEKKLNKTALLFRFLKNRKQYHHFRRFVRKGTPLGFSLKEYKKRIYKDGRVYGDPLTAFTTNEEFKYIIKDNIILEYGGKDLTYPDLCRWYDTHEDWLKITELADFTRKKQDNFSILTKKSPFNYHVKRLVIILIILCSSYIVRELFYMLF